MEISRPARRPRHAPRRQPTRRAPSNRRRKSRRWIRAKWQHETTRAAAARGTSAVGNGAASRGKGTDQWRLRPGQLVIVDEASLAATLTLDHLTTQASGAGAKVLLVGDHHQLGAINAGGAFALLAQATHAAELTLLWRFRNRWEAHTSRRLRRGDPAAIDEVGEFLDQQPAGHEL